MLREAVLDLCGKSLIAYGAGIVSGQGAPTTSRMLELVGWKRLEVNKLMSFAGVSERNFNSILRRSLVWKPRGRFVDKEFLRTRYPDAAEDGIFPADEELRTWLRSGPCVAAAIRLQHGFECDHGRQECIDLIESYVVRGGDCGLTEDAMRQACGLRPCNRQNDDAVDMPPALRELSSQEGKDGGAIDDGLHLVFRSAMDSCLEEGRDFSTKGVFLRRALPEGSPNISREQLWTELTNRGFMQKAGRASGKAKDCIMPVIKTKKRMEELYNLQCEDTSITYTETHNVGRLRRYLHGHPDRECNVLLLISFLDAVTNAKRKKGKPTEQDRLRVEDMLHRAGKLRAHEELCGKLLHHFEQADPGASQVSAKRRRCLQKSPSDTVPDKLVSLTVAYRYAGTLHVRGRRNVVNLGAQSFPRRALVHLASHTIDLDIENAMFVLVDQLLDMVAPSTPMPEELRDAVRQCARDRQRVCEHELRCSVKAGKPLLNATLNGKGLHPPLDANAFLVRLSKAARYLRWLACSMLPEVYQDYCQDASRRFPEASTFTRFWTTAEDLVLTAWVDYVKSSPIGHLSLHFDGIRLQMDNGTPVDEYCQACSQYIKERTGFSVTIREKKHHTFRELVSVVGTEKVHLSNVDPAFQKPGNCIIAGLAHLFSGDKEKLLDFLKDEAAPHNLEAGMRQSRSYLGVQVALGYALVPSYNPTALKPGSYLIHHENSGQPHCLALERAPGSDTVHIFDVDTQYSIGVAQWPDMCFDAVDKSSIVAFQVFQGHDSAVWPDTFSRTDLESLLELRAGARGKRRLANAPLSDDLVCDVDVDPVHTPEEHTSIEGQDVDESVVFVGDEILEALRGEVTGHIARLRKTRGKAASTKRPA